MSIETISLTAILQSSGSTDSAFVGVVLAIIVIVIVIVASLVFSGRNKAFTPKRPTILVCGATGVGKSTLINTLLGVDIAKTGSGEPVTQNTLLVATNDSEFVFYDSKGLEVEDASQTYLLLMGDLLRLRFGSNPSEQIDLVLMCIQEPQGRVDDAHHEIAGLCQDLRIPLAIALTKKEGNVELEQFVRRTFQNAVFVREIRSLPATYSTFTLPAEGVTEIKDDIRRAVAKSRTQVNRRAQRGRNAQALANSARRLAATGAKSDSAWTGFAREAWLSLDMRGKKWETLIKEQREQVKRLIVPGFFKRTLNTRFDDGKIDAAIARRLLPIMMRRFADESGSLLASDFIQLIYEPEPTAGRRAAARKR